MCIEGGGNNLRSAIMLGMLTKDNLIKANVEESERSIYTQERYSFFLDAPFEISNRCCFAMKKAPAKHYHTKTGRVPITAQMASESKVRTKVWLRQSCNAFSKEHPISNPMTFWTEQDVLAYIYANHIPIASVYGNVVSCDDEVQGQMNFTDLGLFDCGRPTFETTGVSRSGCLFCGFGCHLPLSADRFTGLRQTHPKQYAYIMKPWEEGGLGYKDVIDWINEHGNMHIKY